MTKKKIEKFVDKKKKKKGAGGAASSRSKKQKRERSAVHKRSRKSDSRYSQKSMMKELNKRTGKRWEQAYDPMVGETKKGGQTDAMKTDWNKKSSVYLNPPFSDSKRFVRKLVGDMKKDKKIKNAMVVLPWYQTESKTENRSRSYKPQWHHKLDPDMKTLNKKEHNLGNQPFWNPHKKEMVNVRVYGIHLSR